MMKQYAVTIFCVLAIVAIVSAAELKRVKRGGCYCRQEKGTYCGSTKRSGALSGDCSEHDMYFCREPDSLSKWQGPCPNGCFAGTGGADYCK